MDNIYFEVFQTNKSGQCDLWLLCIQEEIEMSTCDAALTQFTPCIQIGPKVIRVH